eukprot:3100440-Amphidinium_carterae.1
MQSWVCPGLMCPLTTATIVRCSDRCICLDVKSLAKLTTRLSRSPFKQVVCHSVIIKQQRRFMRRECTSCDLSRKATDGGLDCVDQRGHFVPLLGGVADLDSLFQYVASCQWALAQLTLGSADVQASSQWERVR